MPGPFVRRVVLNNFKSIARCDVILHPLTLLVGRNGSGKSNFVDALRLVADALRTSLDSAIRTRGGIKEVRRRSSGHPTSFEIRLEVDLPDNSTASYSFRVSARGEGGWSVVKESCQVATFEAVNGALVERKHYFNVVEGNVTSSEAVLPPPAEDRLLLVAAAGLPPFKVIFEQLSTMGFYTLNPTKIREPQVPDAGDLLLGDGGNLSSVLGALERRSPETMRRIVEYLARVVPGVVNVGKASIGAYETLEFRQEVQGAAAPWTFTAKNMSDGTLRATAILVALFQSAGEANRRTPLVAIEEPEIALHPAAAGVLLGCLRDASRDTQVIVTSHSGDLLDDETLPFDSIVAVRAEGGVTVLGPIDEIGRSTIRDQLFTAGELLRMDQLQPESSEPKQATMFREE